MDRRIGFGLLLAATTLSSCQRELESMEPWDGSRKVAVTAKLGEDGTRTSISHDDDGGRYVFHWEAGDRIDLLEAAPSSSSQIVEVYVSDPVPDHCDIATFSTELGPREVEGDLLYIASYPSGVLAAGSNYWNTDAGSFVLPFAIPNVQHPGAESFDPAADLLVSEVTQKKERPSELDFNFTRLGTIFKLELTGLGAGTLVHGGTVSLGYACQGDVIYNSATSSITYPQGGDVISFRYSEEDPVTGELTGTPLIANNAGKATVWLRLRPGVADRMIHVAVDAETSAGEAVQYSRDINLMTRGKSLTFREGGLTTMSVQVNGTVPGDGVIPRDLRSLPAIYINTPGGVNITSKVDWLENTLIRIVGDNNKLLFEDTAAKIRGRGNSTWGYPKKPYYFKLDKKTDLLGTGKSKKWVLLANWLDRTLLRNVVAFEAARRTSIEWTPSGTFVDLYLNGSHKGVYWLGEKIEVESARLAADYLFSMDTSDASEIDFYTQYGYRIYLNKSGLPVEVKYPDRDDYPDGFDPVLQEAKSILQTYGKAISIGEYKDFLDMDSFCDWYLVHELSSNWEPNHPKSCYSYIRNGRFYSGPVWDFDWETFVLGKQGLINDKTLYYRYLLQNPDFYSYLCQRWMVLRPKFQSLDQFIDAQADWIRNSEAVNHQMWPVTKIVNKDESLTFQQAIDRMKKALNERIEELDKVFGPGPVGAGVEAAGQGTQFVTLTSE